MAYQAIINNEDFGKVSPEDLIDLEITQIKDGQISVRIENDNIKVECLDIDMSEKTLTLRVDGVLHTVQILDDVDQMVQSLGMEVEAAGATGDIEAPMPGKVLAIKVKEGQEVTEGDPLIILEAMKMENILKAQGPGRVESINAKIGQTVEKGGLLITMS